MVNTEDIKLGVMFGGAAGLVIGMVGFSTLRDEYLDVHYWVIKGTCTNEFGPEARARGYTVPKSMEKVNLDADVTHGICTAEFPDGKGGTARFSWEANKGTHIPAPAASSVAPAASAP